MVLRRVLIPCRTKVWQTVVGELVRIAEYMAAQPWPTSGDLSEGSSRFEKDYRVSSHKIYGSDGNYSWTDHYGMEVLLRMDER